MAWRPWYREIGDQILHALWAGVSVWLIMLHYVTAAFGVLSLGVLVWREVEQWPPAEDRPYDFLLDCGGYAVGAIIGFLLG